MSNPINDLVKIIDAFNKSNNENEKNDQKEKFIQYISKNIDSLTKKPPSYTGANGNTLTHGIARVVKSDFLKNCNKEIEPKINNKVKSMDCNTYCTSETNTFAYGPQLYKIKEFILNNPEIFEKYKELYSDFFTNDNLHGYTNCVNKENANGNCLLPIDFANLCNKEMGDYILSSNNNDNLLDNPEKNQFIDNLSDKSENKNDEDEEPDWYGHYVYDFSDENAKKEIEELEKERERKIQEYLKRHPEERKYRYNESTKKPRNTLKKMYDRLFKRKAGKKDTKTLKKYKNTSKSYRKKTKKSRKSKQKK